MKYSECENNHAAALADLVDGERGLVVAADHTPQAVEVNVGDVVYLIDT